MIFWVGITDDKWFEQLSVLGADEVNFWQPGPTPPRHMDPGMPFLFKLHSPKNYIVGGGFFVRFTVLPCSLAWKVYGENNGVKSLGELVQRMTHFRRSPQTASSQIGCNLLATPFFFPERDWIPIPSNFSLNIQRGLTYDTDETHGAALWAAIAERLERRDLYQLAGSTEDQRRFGKGQIIYPRIGQRAFRILVTDAYNRRCAVTGERTLPALEAAHIKDYSKSGPHDVTNGLLLRADVHELFDDGYVTITPDLRFKVSTRVREEFENGREYYRFDDQRLNLPDSAADRPSPEFIRWHNTERFEKIQGAS